MHGFGIILWQLCSRRVPFNGYSREQLESMVMEGGHRPELLGNIPDALQHVMTACWNPDPRVIIFSINYFILPTTHTFNAYLIILKRPI